MSAVERHRLPFDPVEEAAKQWATHWGEVSRMRAWRKQQAAERLQ